MNRPLSGIPLFRLFGIQVYLHWSWFLIAFYDVQQRRSQYISPLGSVSEIVSLFAIVTLHEFGHALACRSVGGQAERILLWPLGGVAFVSPPQRPGAYLWSIAAGPLVNVVLAPVLYLLLKYGQTPYGSDAYRLLVAINTINLGLLIFNLLPIYPLDGGQILRSLLWFAMGPGHSLRVATIVGMIGAAGGLVFSVMNGDQFLIVIALFAAWQCWIGFQYASRMLAHERASKQSNVPRGTII